MKKAWQLAFILCWSSLPAFGAEEVLFQDDFSSRLAEGWSWRREDPAHWRIGQHGLEICIQPGNLWGGANNVRNVLVRSLPETDTNGLEIQVTVENQPSGQYEQANVAWYYDDSHMVKLGLEQVDGKVCIVMGREEADRCRTLGLHPIQGQRVHLRLRVTDQQIRGFFQVEGTTEWREAGTGTLPVPAGGKAQISLHAYQGLPDVRHWARFSNFRINKWIP